MSKKQDNYNNLNIEGTDKVFKDCLERFNVVYGNINLNRKELLNAISKILLDYMIENDSLKLTDKQIQLLKKQLFELLEGFSSSEYEEQKKAVKENLETTIIEQHNLKYYILSIGIKNVKPKKLKKEKINKIINEKFEDKNWKQRLKSNISDIEIQLKKDIKEFLVGNISVNDIKKKINNRYSMKANDLDRLVQTEIARVQTRANEEFFKEEGIEQLLYLATLDSKTCRHCQKYDGKKFDINDPNRPELPLHPYCRCCYTEIINNWQPLKRRDNEIVDEHIDFTDYEHWKENK